MNTPLVDFSKSGGLLPAIIQESGSGKVLMLGYMNDASLQKSVETGYVYFYSRSRGRLWKKGETSGNMLKIEQISIDCDGDSFLVFVSVCGSGVCHTGNRSCFFRRFGREV